MLDEAEYLMTRNSGLGYLEFERDETVRRAFIRSLEVIGEAARKVPPSFRDQIPELEWRSMAGMRDRLIHDYFGVDFELVSDVVQNRIPELRARLAAILETPNK